MDQTGTLYIVGTPIGNLEDISARALRTLEEVDMIAAEDTRQSRKLLTRYGITTPLVAHHQHNQSRSTDSLLKQLLKGQHIALISDAGTPLVSDPGETLVNDAHQHGIQVVPIPGASALSAALSVCGLDINPVYFEGFLPARNAGRKQRLQQLADHQCALVFFEAPHRIMQSLDTMIEVFGVNRQACIAREMTKLHEQVQVDKLANLKQLFCDNSEFLKGEFVVIIAPPDKAKREIDAEVERTLEILIEEMSPRKAAEVTAKIHGVSRNALYKYTLQLQSEASSDSNTETSAS